MPCQHLNELTLENLIPKANYPVFRCEECMRINGRWVHLRICQTCGKMLCCDSSEHQHSRRHYEETGHTLTLSALEGRRFLDHPVHLTSTASCTYQRWFCPQAFDSLQSPVSQCPWVLFKT